jgi:hypothetical protein
MRPIKRVVLPILRVDERRCDATIHAPLLVMHVPRAASRGRVCLAEREGGKEGRQTYYTLTSHEAGEDDGKRRLYYQM